VRVVAALLVNVLGSTLLGFLYAVAPGEHAMALLGVGFCGGFTTWSSLAVQTHDRGWSAGGRYLAPTVVLALAGCTAGDPQPEQTLVGTRTQLCAERVDAAGAGAVVGQPIAGLQELNSFQPDVRIGECALTDADGGAMLSVQVVRDSKAAALSKELETLSQTENYSGDDHSGVTGEGTKTTALWAIDASYYVRVLGLGGTSAEQRTAALSLAEDVAKRTEPLD